MDSNDVRREWAERSGEYSPEYYAYYGPNDASERVRSRLAQHFARDASILELGCSSGRHLAHLADHGFEDVHGIEINDEAIDVMADTYPDLAADGTFYVDPIENVVPDFETNRFEAVYSVETLQHLHPDVTWVFDEIARVTDDVLVTIENEGDTPRSSADGAGESGDASEDDRPGVSYINDDFPLYRRDWKQIFTTRGFTQVETRPNGKDTVRVFRSEE